MAEPTPIRVSAVVAALMASTTTGAALAAIGAAAASHAHAIADITGLSTALAGKAASSHTHATSDVTGLVDALAGKETAGAAAAALVSANSYTDALAEAVNSALSGKAPTSHTHPVGDISGLGAFATGTDAANLTGTIAAARIADGSLPQAKVTGLVSALGAKQDSLVSGTTIKTINGASVLGSGDIVVSGSSPTTTPGDRIIRGASGDIRLPLSGIFAVNDCVATGNNPSTGWVQDTQSGASVAYLASEPGAYGITRVTLATTSDSRVTLAYGNQTSNLGAAYFEGNVMAEVRFRMNALSVVGTKYTVNLFLGRGNLLGDAFGATALRIRGTHDANSGQWQFIADNTADTTVSSSVALVSGVWTALRITDDGTTAEAFINGVSIGTITTNRPTGGTCTVALNLQRIGAGAGTNTIDVDYVALIKP